MAIVKPIKVRTGNLAGLRAVLEYVQNDDKTQNGRLERFKKYRNIEVLDRSLVTELIDRIDVHEGRRLTIHFKFQDEFEKIRAFAEQEQQELKQAV